MSRCQGRSERRSPTGPPKLSLVIRQWVSTNSDTNAPSPAVIAAFGTSVTKRGAGLGVARAAR
jgi:hypothetical protein